MSSVPRRLCRASAGPVFAGGALRAKERERKRACGALLDGLSRDAERPVSEDVTGSVKLALPHF
jgi:hypothetical protein